MTPTLQIFTWVLSIVLAIVATFLLKAPRVLGIILGAILAQGFMFLGVHLLNLQFGPMITVGGSQLPILANIITALIGALIGAAIARAIKRR
ncbi:MAG: hypothetical protein ACXVC1_06655 [Tumebacillaceae bacterium]